MSQATATLPARAALPHRNRLTHMANSSVCQLESRLPDSASRPT